MFSQNEPIHLTRDEYRNIVRCIQDENFRKLFVEYCTELSDPANRKQYEEELTLLESERGYDVKFIKPLPGYVIKTTTMEDTKTFINICHSEIVDKPTSKATRNGHGEKGFEWSIPYAQTHPKIDFDNKKKSCVVYDVIFHHDTLQLAKINANFGKLVTDTAVDAVQSAFNVRLHKDNLKFPKLQYKGVPKMSIIRQKVNKPANLFSEDDNNSGDTTDKNHNNKIDTINDGYTIPEFKLIQRKFSNNNYYEITHAPDQCDILPDELVIEVQLPLLNSASDCVLNIAQNELHLISQKPSKYKLTIKLPCKVSEKNGIAKFITEEKSLKISLPVIKMEQTPVNSTSKISPVSAKAIDSSIEPIIQKSSTISNKNEHPDEEKEDNRKKLFPKFSTNKMDNIFAFTLDVRNVDPASIEIHKDADAVKCEFSNIGSGFFPCYYAFFAHFPNASILDIEYEEWKNCLILKVILDSSHLECYYAGVEKDDLKEYSIIEHISDKYNKYGNEIDDDSLCIEVSTAEQQQKISNMTIEIKTKISSDIEFHADDVNSKNEQKADENTSWSEITQKYNFDQKNEPLEPEWHVNNENGSELKKQKRHSRRKHKKRSLSESCCDQLKVIIENETSKMEPEQRQAVDEGGDVYPEQQRKARSISESCSLELEEATVNKNITNADTNLKTFNRKCKGILKYSSCEDQDLASSIDSSTVTDSLDQPNSYLSECCRKTVRFNEFIKTKLFRSNTSILAQKKKNAKKNESKRRAISRRLSEGESTDNDDKGHMDESDLLDLKVQQYQEHDSGISLHADAELSVQHKLDIDNMNYVDHVARKNLDVLQSSPIDIVRNAGNIGSKLKDSENKNHKKPHYNANKQEQQKDSNRIQFKSEMIFDIEV